MNIKGLLGNSPAIPLRPTEKVDRAIKSDSSHERDANAQQSYQQKEDPPEGPMTQEQLEAAITHLKNLPFVKEHQWQIELVEQESKKFVIVKDVDGHIIRRIPEKELWTLPVDFKDQKGQLLRRSA